MSRAWTIARRELISLRRDRLFLVMAAFLTMAAILSVLIAAAAYRSELAAYHEYVQQLQASGSAVVPAAPQQLALQQLRGAVEYLEILGALLAVIVGYSVIASEKHRHTLPLLLTRPVGRLTVPAGKVLSLAILWGVVVTGVTTTSSFALITVGTARLSGGDVVRILVAGIVAWLYLMMWSTGSMALAASVRRPSTALIVGMAIWLVFVLVIPQIGDTMDPDNQVPGGLFATLGISKADENTVLAHFSSYDFVRNGLEVSSVTKHFERLSFAFLGIKTTFAGQSFAFVWEHMWGYALALVTTTAAMCTLALLSTTRHSLLRRTS